MESSVKGRADDGFAALSMIGDSDDDGEPPDLTGLSCRWTPVRLARGKMVALVIRGPDHGHIRSDITARAGVPALNTGSLESLHARWPPKGLVREAKARRGKKPLWVSTLLVALETYVAYLFVKNKWSLGNFSAEKCHRAVLKGAVDFARTGQSLALVFDCPVDRIDNVRAYLDEGAARGEFRHGMHISDHAVMTCLVTSAVDDQHVHFVKGGDSAYTGAATQLKARLKAE